MERYDALRACDTGGVYILPVLQEYAAKDYVSHIRQYGDRLGPRAWVGVGFGIKITALGLQLVRDLLFSADSMAWSFAARREGRDRNSPAEARRYAQRVHDMPTQLAFGRW